jgi:hypothetical protein
MARMAGNIGVILAVGLLGCTRTCPTVLVSLTVGLNQAYGTVRTNRGQTGTSWPTSTRPGGGTSLGRGRRKRDQRNELRGTEGLEAIMAGFLIAASIALFLGTVVAGTMWVIAREVRREDKRYTLAGAAPGLMSRIVRRVNGVTRRNVDHYFRPVGELVR